MIMSLWIKLDAYWLVLLVMCTSCNAVGIGFELLFSTNDDVVDNQPIKFCPALPFPITGSYVRNYSLYPWNDSY